MLLSQDLHNNDLDDVPTDFHDHVVGGHDDAGGQYFDVDSVDVDGSTPGWLLPVSAGIRSSVVTPRLNTSAFTAATSPG